ncbi:type II toxin-antitoxin system RelE/ParE family toxin [Mucilaginibacter sp. 14171R-50]|nr:type II toxin-antitoxin system RelE/ParE family toxin [Mucilaginibacter sp. 14171R-50]
MTQPKLIWSLRSLTEYEQLLSYLMKEWGELITKRVAERINDQINRIQNAPEQFPLIVKSKNIRRCVVSSQTSIFFRVNINRIELLSIFDNRQDPKKRSFLT